MDGPCVLRHRRRSQQGRNNQCCANKSEFHHGLLPFAVSRVLIFATPDTFGARANNAIRFLFQFAAQLAQIAVMTMQTQIAAQVFRILAARAVSSLGEVCDRTGRRG